jgi:hypothetical protein
MAKVVFLHFSHSIFHPLSELIGNRVGING